MLLTPAELDSYRTKADPILDDLLSSHEPETVGRMLGALFKTDRIPEGDPKISRLFEALPAVPVENPERIEAGQQLFQLYGPEVLLVLGCYGLPAAYAAADGVQVIYRARRLADDTQRRLCETAQMLLDVMVPGGLAENGIGVRSARKVRVMHALVRRHVRMLKTPSPWSPSLGEPINQEDLAGTLLTFSALVLDGLKKLGVELSASEELGYMEVWHHIGLLLGIDARLAPRSVADARALAALVGPRQFRASPEGRELIRDLVTVTNALFPVPGYGLSLMHFFLDESVFGVNLAKVLELPAANWTRGLVAARAAQKRWALRWLNRVPGARERRRAFAGRFAQQLILWKRPDRQSPFEVPAPFLERWRLSGPRP
jgi:hypothetical protein